MALPSNQNRRNNKDWHGIITRFLNLKYKRLKRIKIVAIFILLVSAITIGITIFSNVKSGYADVKSVFKSEHLKEITKTVKRKYLLNNATLFSDPFLFAKDLDTLANGDFANMGNIEFSNDDGLYINISPINTPCGPAFKIINEDNTEDGTTHKIVPEYLIDTEEKQPDFYRLFEVEAQARENYGYPPTKEDLAYRAEQEKYMDFNYDSLERTGPCAIDGSKGGHLDMPIKYQNPGVEVKINNNSEENILIYDSYIHVKLSRTNPFPYIEFGAGSMFSIPIFNEGWGDATNLKMLFNIQKEDDSINYNVPLKYELSIARLTPTTNSSHYYEYETTENLKTALASEGVKTEMLTKGSTISKYVIREMASKAGLFGRFTNGHARVVGRLIYDGSTADGKMRTDSINFNFFQNLWPEDFGGDSYYTHVGAYNIQLLADSKDYKVPVRLSESISPKSAGKFTLLFDCNKSSYHLFDLVVNYNKNKQVVVKDIFLNRFIKSSERELYKKRRKGIKMVVQHP